MSRSAVKPFYDQDQSGCRYEKWLMTVPRYMHLTVESSQGNILDFCLDNGGVTGRQSLAKL